jgi:hypothetical protein
VGKHPTARGKLGPKRRLRTDGGVPGGLAGEGAHRHDCKMVQETVESIPVARPVPTPDAPQGLCLDQGDDYDAVRDLRAEFGFPAHLRARGRGQSAAAGSGVPGAAVGVGTDAERAESVPPGVDPLGQESPE